MIIAGYQGIGKSTFVERINDTMKVFEVESSDFQKENLWQVLYVQEIIQQLSIRNEDSIVLISTHPVVINELARRGYEVMIVVPNLDDRERATEALLERYNETKLIKDYHAYKGALEGYDQQILKITREGYPNAVPYMLDKGKYLMDEIKDIKLYYEMYILNKEGL